jgi:hypothetical protein
MSRCRFCKHLLHETCGGPRPDQPPNLQRCDACSAAFGLDRLTSSDDDDSRSDHDYDTSLDGFIASSEDEDEDDGFDFNALVDRDDDSIAEGVSSSAASSASGSPPAATGRKRANEPSGELPARISIQDSEETQPLLSAVKAPASRPAYALAVDSDSDSSGVAVVGRGRGRGRGGAR